MNYNIILSSYHYAKKINHDKFSVARNKPFWCTYPDLQFLGAFDSNNNPLLIDSFGPSRILKFEDELRKYYVKKWDEINKWLESLKFDDQIALCCWCPHSKTSKQQLKDHNSFLCHTLLIGKMINRHRPDLIVQCDDEREISGYRPWMDWYFKNDIQLIISGGQTGADEAGLRAAKYLNIKTSGWMPKGFMTQNGPRPEFCKLFNVIEHSSATYPPRTFSNVKDSDATIRFARDFTSSGELLTLKAITQYKRPFLDIDITNPLHPNEVRLWLRSNNIKKLNIAGNAEKRSKGIHDFVFNYLVRVFGGK
jgi:hypothetical protein